MELPDDLLRRVKVKAAQENRRLKDVVADLLRAGLAAVELRPEMPAARVQLPLVHTAHAAGPATELTPARVAEILAAEATTDLR